MAPEPVLHDGPTPAEIRRQVERMAASTVFANSPQLVAFLRFIVEAVLHGRGERLKGYVIGVEVLRRDTDFDPQIDPIVRVEATRLRRALERYYAGPGAGDPIIIDLPRGGYAPQISQREPGLRARNEDASELAVISGTAPVARPAISGLPTLRVAPFVVLGTPDTRALAAERLSGRLAEAFSLFDAINVVAGAMPATGRADYRLDGVVEYRGGETVDLRFKLIDERDTTIVWSKVFERLDCRGNRDVEQRVILELASTLIEPFGIIWAQERARQLSGTPGDPRYRAIIEADDAFRAYDRAGHEHARATLEQLTAEDPSFAIGFTYLGAVYCREYMFGYAERENDTPALDRALRAARRGIELSPQCSRCYHILFMVLFFRRELDAAFGAAERAIALNPYDMIILAEYGGRLICCGEVDKGMTILERAGASGALRPAWEHFYLFMGYYQRHDVAHARLQGAYWASGADGLTGVAQVLLAVIEGDPARARQEYAALIEQRPRWRDIRRELNRFFPTPKVADALAADLAAAGLPVDPAQQRQ
ncbi:MAG TPA: hypothetical protein VFB45_08070 [Pseudolabrys sp.]|nr:hypothetical protein [Pseudolabrys sp.]